MKFAVPVVDAVHAASPEIEFTDESLRTSVGKIVKHSGVAGYEPETLAAAVACIQAYRMERFADVGANIGIYSMVLKSIFGEHLIVDAYEPLPMLNDMARQLFMLNGLKVDLHDEAVSSKVGSANFYVSAKSDSSNSLNSKFREAKDVIQVSLTTLDRLYGNSDTKPKLLKIDTESTEPDVLAGGLELIRNQRPWMICEILYRRVEPQIKALLEPLGYKFYHLNGNPLIVDEPLIGDRTYQHRDWLLAPEAPSAHFNKIYAEWQMAFKRCRL